MNWQNIIQAIGAFVCDHYEAGLIVGLIFLMVGLIAQTLINGSLEEDIIELVERVEALEKKCGIEHVEEEE